MRDIFPKKPTALAVYQRGYILTVISESILKFPCGAVWY
nr:MAG TPA: hypothetical protein [Bacteriophage sp.]